ncbi:MAG: hypothetical protein HYX51_05255 [Chloroflexi bacterium]|nr:hypothetical protein [Chloroflexota bacterium]
MIWFINNGAAACGRLSHPFSTLAAFNTVNVGGGNNPDDNQAIFIYESGTQYTGAVALRTGQRLIGQDATAALATIAGITLPPNSATLPSMNSGNGTCRQLLQRHIAHRAGSLPLPACTVMSSGFHAQR